MGVLIASLGILGMISFSLENKKKEIGIRKVNGARAKHIYLMLLKSFSLNIALAFAISLPLAWFGGKAWLNDFAYRTSLTWWIFLFAGLVAWLIAVAAISLQSLRAAKQSPLKTLRYE
jgi:putative ABC transport system permease protein